MQVYKFGGASVKDAAHIQNVVRIVQNANTPLLVVVSAIGKTTDQLVKITDSYFHQEGDPFELLLTLKQQHVDLLEELFPPSHPVYDEVANTFVEIEWILEEDPQDEYDYLYDQIVSIGELLSSKIVEAVAQ